MKQFLRSAVSLITSVVMVFSVFAGFIADGFSLTADAFGDKAELIMTATEGSVGDVIEVIVSGENMAGLMSGDFSFTYDSDYLEYIEIVDAPDAGFTQATGGKVDGVIYWSFYYRTYANSDRNLVILKFRVLKEGATTINLEVSSWDGTDEPDNASVTVGSGDLPEVNDKPDVNDKPEVNDKPDVNDKPEADPDAARLVMTATEGSVGDVIEVTVSGENMAGLTSGDFCFTYDSDYLEYVDIVEAADASISQSAGGEYEGDVYWSFFYKTYANSDSGLVVVKFRVLKEGATTINLNIYGWGGTDTPDNTSVTVGAEKQPEDDSGNAILVLTATEASVGESIYITVSGENLDGLESADLDLYYDPEMFEFVNVKAADENMYELSDGGDIGGGTATFSFVFIERMYNDGDLAVFEFTALKEGTTEVSVGFYSWDGIPVPEQPRLSITVAECEHNLEWETEYPATYFDSGSEIGTCTICGYTEKVEIPILIPDKDYTDEKTSIAVQYNEKLYDGDLEIKAQPESEGAAFNLLNDVKGNYKSRLFDIYVTLDGETIQPNGYVLVGIPLPEGYSTEMTKVYYVSPEDNSLTELPGSYFYEGYIWFQTDHFSSYAIVDESVEIEKPDTSASKLGDVNLDGEITASDARMVLRVSAELDTLETELFSVADVNKDGEITASDARSILRVSAELDTFE